MIFWRTFKRAYLDQGENKEEMSSGTHLILVVLFFFGPSSRLLILLWKVAKGFRSGATIFTNQQVREHVQYDIDIAIAEMPFK